MNKSMNILTINEMAECSANGEGWGCLGAIAAWVGSVASLAAGPAGWLIAAEMFGFTVNGINLAYQCAQWLQDITKDE